MAQCLRCGAWLLPDGLHAVLVSHTQIGVLDLATGQVRALPKLSSEFIRAAVSLDGMHIVIGAKTRRSAASTRQPGRSLGTAKLPGIVSAIAITPDGERVAVSGEKVGYMEWALADGAEVRRHESLQASQFAFSPDGSHAVAVNDGGVELWSMDDGKVNPIGPGLNATAVCMTADGDQALAIGIGREVKSWSVADGKPTTDRPALMRQGVTGMTLTRDGTLLFGSQSGEIGYLGADGTNALFGFGTDSGPVVSFSITADGRHALVASEKASVVLTRLSDLVRPGGPSETGPTAGSLQFVGSVAVTTDSNRFAADAMGERLLVATPTHLRIISGDKFSAGRPLAIPGGGIVSVGFGPDESIVVCQAGAEGITTRTFDPRGGDAGPPFVVPGVGGAGLRSNLEDRCRAQPELGVGDHRNRRRRAVRPGDWQGRFGLALGTSERSDVRGREPGWIAYCGLGSFATSQIVEPRDRQVRSAARGFRRRDRTHIYSGWQTDRRLVAARPDLRLGSGGR